MSLGTWRPSQQQAKAREGEDEHEDRDQGVSDFAAVHGRQFQQHEQQFQFIIHPKKNQDDDK